MKCPLKKKLKPALLEAKPASQQSKTIAQGQSQGLGDNNE